HANTGRLDQELQQDRAALGTDCFADANFSSSFRNRNEHDVHDPDASHKQGQTGNEQADGSDRARQSVEHVNDLVLLVDGKIVRVVRGEASNFAHHIAHFFLGFFDLIQFPDFYLDLVIGEAPEGSHELFKGDNGLVIQAAAVQEAALLFQNT